MGDAKQRVRQVFMEVADLPPDACQTALTRVCGEDAALRAEVEALLRAEHEAGEFMGKPTVGVPSAVPAGAVVGDGATYPAWNAAVVKAAANRERPGTKIGHYTLLESIGEGGFGTVFLAEQSEPVKRRVALKIIKLGMDTREVVARFEQERQALAMMDHPNIAKVFDAGATDSGRPYFVMELVKGEPVTDYCDKNNLSIGERLELFDQICTAVQHAHTKGIIHRDIKPSNILVSSQDSKPTAKVIDFGVAKATASKLTERTLFTEHKQLIGTPEYMSPEQAEGNLDIDTRTDVYALGVLLYELLTGSTPFSSKELRSAAYGEIQRIIREVDPPNPSARLATSVDTAVSVAASRRTEPRKLGLIVRGELDWIVMKALEKDRSRRYETANGLGADIRRYLSGEAVVAAPPSSAYKLKKLVRRNKGVVSAAGAVAAALLIGIVAFAWQATAARDQRDRAVAAEIETKTRAQELAKVSEFQSKMLGEIDATDAGVRLMADIQARYAAALAKSGEPEAQRSERVATFGQELLRANATDTALDMIDRTILKPAIIAVHEQFKAQPVVEAALEQTLAGLYRTLGRYDDALPLQEKALATRRRELGNHHPGTMESIGLMGRLLQSQGKPEQAEPLFREALDSRRATLGSDDPATLDSIQYMGRVLQDLNKFDQAEPLLREAMESSRRLLGNDDHETLNCVGSMGLLLDEMGKSEAAEPLVRETMDGARRIKGEDHRDTIASINNYGFLLQRMGKSTEAERYLSETLERARRALGEEHWMTLNAINNVASVLEAQGKTAQAEPLYRECLDKGRRTLGSEHPITLRAVGNLGNNLRAQGKAAEAAPYLREAMDTDRRVMGEDHRTTLVAINTYGYLLIEQGKPAQAEPFWREAYEKGRKGLGEDHPDVLIWTNNLGGLLRSLGRLDEAEPLLRTALEKSRRVQGNDHPGTISIMGSVARLLQAQNKTAEAEPLLREALDARRRVLIADHPDTLQSMQDLGGALRTLDKLPEAEALFREAIAAYERTQGKDHWLCGSARVGLARALAKMNRFDDAQAEFVSAERILASTQGVPPGRYKAAVEQLVSFYESWDKAEPGKGYDAKAVEWKAKLPSARDK